MHRKFPQGKIFELPSFFASLKPDLVLMGGDFTTTSLPAEYALGLKFTKMLPAPWLAIPGNHDHYTFRAYRQKHFYKWLTNKREVHHRTGFFNLKEHGVEAHKIAPKWWVVALDTARPTLTTARGLFSPKQEERLLELLSFIPKDASILLFNHYPFFQNDIYQHNLERGEALEQVVRNDLRIKAYLHGHTHRHIIADLQLSGLPVILDSGCCADKNGTWNLLTFDDHGMKVDVYKYKTLSHSREIAWTRGLTRG